MSGVINQQGILDNLNLIFNWINGQPQNLPVLVNPSIQPVIDINPLSNPLANTVGSIAVTVAQNVQNTTATYHTPTNTDFYLTQFYFMTNGNSGPDVVYTTATINGVVVNLATYQTSTSILEPMFVNCIPPLKIDRNTDIIVLWKGTPSSNTGLFSGVYGFTYNSNPTGIQPYQYANA